MVVAPPPKRVDEPPSAFKIWVDSFGLGDLLDPLVRTVAVWANYCSPQGASEQQMTTVCADLILWFFYLDDYVGDDYLTFFQSCSAILEGNTSPDASPLLRAYSDVVGQVASYNCDVIHYLESRRSSLEFIRQRIQFGKEASAATLTYDEYYAQRMVSVYVYQWMDMWEIVGGFYLDSNERSLPEIAEAKRAVTAWHILQNDLRSLRRDVSAGEPNLVLLYAKQHGLRLDETVDVLLNTMSQELAIFEGTSRALLATDPSDRVQRYLALLEICVTGGRASFNEISERYEADARKEISSME